MYIQYVYASKLHVFVIYIYIGDDCIAVESGSSHIYITRVTCGPGHGIRFENMEISYNDDDDV